MNNFYLIWGGYSAFDGGFSVFIVNIFIYVLVAANIFSIFFLFDLRYVKTLNELKVLGNAPATTIFIITCFLSMAGLPPFLGFIGKFLLFLHLFGKSNWAVLVVITFVNFFVMYFYIQNLRFLAAKKIYEGYCVRNYRAYFNRNLSCLVILLNTLNIFGIFYFEELLNFFVLLGAYSNTF